MNFSTPLSFAVLCLIASTSFAQTLVEDTNIELFGSTPNYQATIYQDVEGTDPTSIWFTIDEGPSADHVTITFEDISLDEGSDWYLTQFNDVFSMESIATGIHELWGGFGGPNGDVPILGGEIDVPIGDFYLGVNTDACFCFPGTRDIFGWALLNVDADLNLQLVDNAVAYNSSQIIIGRNAISVPEPSMLFTFFAFVMAIRITRTWPTQST